MKQFHTGETTINPHGMFTTHQDYVAVDCSQTPKKNTTPYKKKTKKKTFKDFSAECEVIAIIMFLQFLSFP